jgi:hypothetical protein
MSDLVFPIAWLRDLDGTGSLHTCANGDPGAIPVYAAREIERLTARVAELQDINAKLVLEARIHSTESDTQKSTVHEIYQDCTGAIGEPGDWNGAEPVRKAIKDAREKALREAAEIARHYDENVSMGAPDAILELLDKQ